MLDALIPFCFITITMGGSVYLFGDTSSSGPNQAALLSSAALAIAIGMKNGLSWKDMEAGLLKGIELSLKPILILILVGALIGVWIASGTVPYLILLGTAILAPEWFYAATCLICAIVALSIGSSWTVAGTLGVAFIGAGQALNLDLAITAGAVISGAYFGDKMSPLSDSTNLAAASTETDLFAHIRHMIWTSVPALLLAMIGFLLASPSMATPGTIAQLDSLGTSMTGLFNLSFWCLIPPLVLLILSIRRIPPLPALAAGIAAGILVAVFVQTDTVRANDPTGSGSILAILAGIWVALFDGFQVEIAHQQTANLLQRGGMSSMLNTIWLIFCAMAFGGVMEAAGLLRRLITGILSGVRSTFGLLARTMGTSILTNMLAADQYMAVVMPGRIYRQPYTEAGLKSENLSRALEDSGTLTSVLVPWNTCGAFISATLGVATIEYLPYCYFNLLSLAISFVYSLTGLTILREPVTGHPGLDKTP